MWDLPGPGLEPVSPALASGFLTTAPPGKPSPQFLIVIFELSVEDRAGFLLDGSGGVKQAKGAAPIKTETDLEDFVEDWILFVFRNIMLAKIWKDGGAQV